MKKPARNRRYGARAALAAATIAFAAGPAQAGTKDPFAVLEGLGKPVADEELAEVRGKFIRPNSISFFGISLVTSWQDASGITTTARIVFNVDFLDDKNGKPLPSLMIGWVRDGDPAMDTTQAHQGYTPIATSPNAIIVGGLETTSGAAQANVIAGADNRALNGMTIALVPTASLPDFDSSGLTPITETTGVSFADGDRLEFRLGANEIGLLLTGNNGTDNTLQSVGGELGRLLQQSVLNSDGNMVFNNTALVIGTDLLGGTQFDSIRAAEALSAMKGHGF